jgi:hypothetical protein
MGNMKWLDWQLLPVGPFLLASFCKKNKIGHLVFATLGNA